MFDCLFYKKCIDAFHITEYHLELAYGHIVQHMIYIKPNIKCKQYIVFIVVIFIPVT